MVGEHCQLAFQWSRLWKPSRPAHLGVPIDILQPTSGGRWGPGYYTCIRTDFIGPQPAGTTWQVFVVTTAEDTSHPVALQFFPWQSNGPCWIFGNELGDYTTNELDGVDPGSTQRMLVELVQPNGIPLETLSQPIEWDPTGQLSQLVNRVSGGGGLSEADRSLLESVKTDTEAILGQWANYVSVTLPSLDQVLANIDAKLIGTVLTATGPVGYPIGQLLNAFDPTVLQPANLSNGVGCERLDVDVSLNALYGVELRITDYPEGWIFRTPDKAWSFRDLAVISFWRDGTLIERHGVHTLSHSVSPLPDSVPFTLGPIFAYLQPGGYHITVDWLDGVCGELVGQVLP